MDIRLLAVAAGLALAACSGAAQPENAVVEDNGVSLRNLAASDMAQPAEKARMLLKGDRISTPSDTLSTYFLLRERTGVTGTVIAILREERAGRVVYARTETDCARRLFHVVGVGPTRADAEVAIVRDGPLRPIANLPLRQELARHVCAQAGTPLAPA